MPRVTKAEARKWLGRYIYAVHKNRKVVKGKLVRMEGNRLFVETPKSKKAKTRAILPLVLFDLLAIGALAAYPPGGGYGGYGGGYGGCGGYGAPYGGGYYGGAGGYGCGGPYGCGYREGEN